VKRVVIVLLALAAGCGDSARPVAERSCSPTAGEGERVELAPAGTPSRVRLGPGMELKATRRTLAAGHGQPLVVAGTVRGEDCTPLAGATVNVWQTNGEGRYGPRRGGRDLCCYLQGTVLTAADGRYRLDTVFPGGYDNATPHIHVTAGHPEAEGLITELVFDEPVKAKRFDIVLGPS
jgi:protocatechuate 3,4-dioxygenase beta subunit